MPNSIFATLNLLKPAPKSLLNKSLEHEEDLSKIGVSLKFVAHYSRLETFTYLLKLINLGIQTLFFEKLKNQTQIGNLGKPNPTGIKFGMCI